VHVGQLILGRKAGKRYLHGRQYALHAFISDVSPLLDLVEALVHEVHITLRYGIHRICL
jgi:hypothetical protein